MDGSQIGFDWQAMDAVSHGGVLERAQPSLPDPGAQVLEHSAFQRLSVDLLGVNPVVPWVAGSEIPRRRRGRSWGGRTVPVGLISEHGKKLA
jgi:hypothetical protein